MLQGLEEAFEISLKGESAFHVPNPLSTRNRSGYQPVSHTSAGVHYVLGIKRTKVHAILQRILCLGTRTQYMVCKK